MSSHAELDEGVTGTELLTSEDPDAVEFLRPFRSMMAAASAKLAEADEWEEENT